MGRLTEDDIGELRYLNVRGPRYAKTAPGTDAQLDRLKRQGFIVFSPGTGWSVTPAGRTALQDKEGK